MDESPVQSVVCVIGHPIAGNPSQFCISRIFSSLEIDWQCLSFDVPPESLATAIAGIDVLHFAGALISPPHQTAIAALLNSKPPTPQTPASTLPSPAPPCPDSRDSKPPAAESRPDATLSATPTDQSALTQTSPTEWYDGLARGKDGQWIGCNFLGDTLAEKIREHERQIGKPLQMCVFLGDKKGFDSLTIPYSKCLPPVALYCDNGKLIGWPEPPPATPNAAVADPGTTSPNADTDSPAPTNASPQTSEPGNADPESPQHVPPLLEPLLVIRPQPDPTQNKKASKKHETNRDLIESMLENLHPDSLLVSLAPPGVSWPVLRGDQPAQSSITPLDLEVGRIAAAIRRWTGHDPNPGLLAEAIEEYLEV
jgi:hypothetical protein